MRIPKIYGKSRVDTCPFCFKRATVKNAQDIPVCSNPRHKNLTDLKCACGSYLDVKSGKFGPYFFCFKCGNINFRKGLEMNPKINYYESEFDKKEITITSDEVDLI